MKRKEEPYQPIRLNAVKRPGMSSSRKILLNIFILIVIVLLIFASYFLLGFFGWKF